MSEYPDVKLKTADLPAPHSENMRYKIQVAKRHSLAYLSATHVKSSRITGDEKRKKNLGSDGDCISRMVIRKDDVSPQRR